MDSVCLSRNNLSAGGFPWISQHGDQHVDEKSVCSYAVCSNRRQFCRVGTRRRRRWRSPEVAEREVVVPVAPVVERLEVPVVLAEQRAQLAEQRREPPMRVRRLAAA
jgi:hypothetical protein